MSRFTRFNALRFVFPQNIFEKPCCIKKGFVLEGHDLKRLSLTQIFKLAAEKPHAILGSTRPSG